MGKCLRDKGAGLPWVMCQGTVKGQSGRRTARRVKGHRRLCAAVTVRGHGRVGQGGYERCGTLTYMQSQLGNPSEAIVLTSTLKQGFYGLCT